MNIIIINLDKKNFTLYLYAEKKVDSISNQNAAKNLIPVLDQILQANQMNISDISKIGFLSGPGSFTSARIVCATMMGLKMAHPSLIIVPVRIEEAVASIPNYSNKKILLRCNSHLWHFYDKTWAILTNEQISELDLYSIISPDLPETIWPDLALGIFNKTRDTDIQLEIEPFYGIENF